MQSSNNLISKTGSQFDLANYLREYKTIVEEALDQSLPVAYPEKIYESMRYSLLAGGKRLRPILCIATCEMMGGTKEAALPTACALEMIHTMSLIHDDLPAMDNDDFRRGRATNHKVYGEDIAILAGDGLLTYAFEYIAAKTENVPDPQILKVIVEVAKAVGAEGLVGGQVVDLASEGMTDITEETLTYIHNHKTGALLKTCVVSGALLASASEADIARLSTYAENIGLAFQIIDDILDVTKTSEELGKTAGKDLQAQKATYPALWGLEESQRKADQLIDEAKSALQVFGDKAIPLLALAEFITSRNN
jgi:geranylgeranyl diphosphate synthase type II